MELTKIKSVVIIIEGFVILEISHFIGGKYLAEILLKIYPGLPWATASTLLSSDMSPVVAMTYMSLRLKFIPSFKVERNMLATLLAGIILAWLAVFAQTLFLGREIALAKEIIETQPPYFYIDLFSLLIWGPVLEEILARGYFFEILRRKWRAAAALLISSFLFVLSHAIWEDFGFGLFFIFLNSIIFTFVYMHGGLIAAALTHMFVNCYLVYLNLNL